MFKNVVDRDSCKGRIIVSMTSWTKRVKNVSTTIESILKNTMLPDIIVLNLSIEEFPNMEDDLPLELIEYKERGDIEIIWNEGNTKAFKKFIPTIKKYPDGIIIVIDDDFIYPKDFIETFVNEHIKNPFNPLTGNCYMFHGVQAHCGCASLVKGEYFGPYIDELLDENVLRYELDDIFYTFCATLNRVKYKSVGKTFYYNMEPNEPVDGLSSSSPYEFDDMYEYLVKKIKTKYHINMSALSAPIFWL